MQQPPPVSPVGQISADGQFQWDGTQWVPLAQGTRFPTPWTRPMQLAAAILLAVEGVYLLVTSFFTLNADTIRQGIHSAGTQIPQGMTEDQLVTFSLVTAWIFVVFLVAVDLAGAGLAYFGWRWAFWVLLVLLGLWSIGALIGLVGFTKSVAAALQEVLSLGNIAVFAWMIVGLIRFGPWAMKRPGT
ncbi:MAG TPA: hypothetical protein VHQ03_12235 [Candidatus Dormibacteraeota bacterium]|nr:hypothetical protein [Candidatus Dormibacteraeota bacterium]